MTTAAPALSVVATAEEPTAVEKFNFDGEFQSRIAALTIRDTTFNQLIDGLLEPGYFESELESYLVGVALRYYAKYKKTPSGLGIYAILIREDIESRVLSKLMAAGVIGRLKELFEVDISDRDFVVDQVATFARHQAVQDAMYKAITKLDRKDFDGIATVMRAALDVGINQDGDSYDYGEMIDARTGERLDRAAGKVPPQGITTGYAPLDAVLYHRGWGRKELSVLLGAAKAGKTTALIDFAINAWADGKNVLYVTLEVGRDVIASRMDANISAQAMMELDSHTHDVRAKVADFVSKRVRGDGSKSVFKIEEFPSGRLKPSDLRRLIERYKSKGILFDLVAVDYADLMAPENHTNSAVENSKSVYVDLRGIMSAENIAGLTATQAQRGASGMNVIKADNVADDFNKIRIADLVISINKTDEERAAGRARLHFAASRNQDGGFTMEIEQAIDRMKFITRVIGFA
jgi:replicative DNA helicase